ncbi:hypothetical protein HanRHA438_Chr05g0222731 [Helianthus annuus]|uniref:Uncharacterized protein n=1 Tax=Helianthus annuus TaxID=4232 RepID=A0A251UQQ1_HELAN|nr:hypothetical protein HanXRQr2_Chr17g0796801 [Helianthus annuus]KAF5805766.1 hypothetical protein HanXRQr2_Chr05g0213341 [Helianthus annuus]KAJ0525726.1 hypothetical protein HanHA300_Chr09g0315331 [Helianthus annuus]KAJ0570136.1 hypothetical protein HanHA300_Chr05g0174701 [Helianthus annuus]KAJ0584476.1 hypothetical protein HanHA89_Chr05g0189091 [Helianthus annuus]
MMMIFSDPSRFVLLISFFFCLLYEIDYTIVFVVLVMLFLAVVSAVIFVVVLLIVIMKRQTFLSSWLKVHTVCLSIDFGI